MSLFRMPSLGADMEAGKLVEWLKKPGEAVRRGDVVAVVETQKGAIEIEVFEDGVFDRYLVDLGATVPVGTPLAEIRPPGAPPAPAAKADAVAPAAETPEGAPPAAPETATPAAAPVAARPSAGAALAGRSTARRRVTPAARRRAARTGVDLAALQPGPSGAVTLREVEGAAVAPAAAPPQAAMREAIAAAMTRAKREIPHYYLTHECDMTALESFVAEVNAGRGPEERLLPGAFYLRAVALALERFGEFNGHFIDGSYQPAGSVHAGMAVALRGGGLVAPAIFDVETLPVAAIMAALRDAVARARGARLRARELSEGTITVSSLGDRGVDALFPVIYPPQVAIVGVGSPRQRPWVVDGGLVPRRIATLSLAADHRVSDGHRGALFLRAIDALLQTPESL